ncbi:HAD-IIIC family phosphatase [Sphingomonas solaris]|uniref:HAD-IIIC family phosphatase n=1 Tax=Alterirhizorhabdus solaris TaxID=2529389 RepID=A0A558R1L3_9SPHN|nr:HAD-IIIC family phosphatase [Sphingomonas solaris]TVV73218.1 HAD-IIIC family phosphatase [Sphingomonas solaris]
MLKRHEIVMAWDAFLGRLPPEDIVTGWQTLASQSEALEILAYCEEFQLRRAAGQVTLQTAMRRFNENIGKTQRDIDYFIPTGLSRGDVSAKRVLLVGTCVFDQWLEAIAAAGETTVFDHVLVNNSLPVEGRLPHPRSSYDFQIVQVPYRIVNPEYDIMPLNYADMESYQTALRRSIELLRFQLDIAMAGSAGLPTFVINYALPQLPMLGRLIPANDIRNPARYTAAINDALIDLVAGYPNAYVLDLNSLAATFGRRFVQDDAFWAFSHGGFINDFDHFQDVDRLEPQAPLSSTHDFDVTGFIRVVWEEAKAMARTISGIGAVKMVCVDLDDTMWRGILAERDQVDGIHVEGWPLGFAEALSVLKKRGIILAIISKNDEARIADLWPKLFGPRMSLDDFPIRKINWNPKVDSIRAALAEANVLPESVIFIDDNPVERAAVEAAFPQIRTMGGSHLEWRRTLLWSAETQTVTISSESARRNDMIKAQIVREDARASLSREAFLASLGVRVTLDFIDRDDDARFGRALELVNKTNQFNTNGHRWTHAEALDYFAAGGRWWVFDVSDNYTSYGLVGVLAERQSVLDQFVMSCRVFGLGVEQAVLAALTDRARSAGLPAFSARIHETEKNSPCRSVYKEGGWALDNDVWTNTLPMASPSHIVLTITR